MSLPSNVVSFQDLQATLTPDSLSAQYGFSSASATFQATKFVESERFKEMDRWQSYADCTQHDTKRYDFDGRVMKMGAATSQALLSEKARYYVPMKIRRPSTPYRIIMRVRNAFTNLVFGEGRFPDFPVKGDDDAQDFLEALIEATALPLKAILLRNLGGAVGTAGMSWCYNNGEPMVDVHNGKNLHVQEWSDRTRLIPKHVTEVYRYKKDVWDEQKKAMIRELWWYRRDWTETADVMFTEQKAQGSKEPSWVVDEEKTVVHNDGFCHFVWVQNIPNGERVDGLPDALGVWEQSDSLDIMWSVLVRGGIANLDPTLKLKMDPEVVSDAYISKGSDHAICTGRDGDASYLELGGSSITAGLSLVGALKNQILETVECVIPDPDKVAAAGTSSVALKMVFATMLGKCEVLREQYGKALREILRQMLIVAQRHWTAPVVEARQDEEGNEYEIEVQEVVNLPPRVEEEPVLDAMGNPTGEVELRIEPQNPGSATQLECSWGPYFNPTSDDQQKVCTTLATATGGKAFVGRKSAVAIAAAVFSRDPAKMEAELDSDDKAYQAQQSAIMGGMDAGAGGEVASPTYGDEVSGAEAATRVAGEQGPEGAEIPLPDTQPMGATGQTPQGASSAPQGTAPPVPAAVKIALTSTDIATIVTVNEARVGIGLGPMILPDGSQDPDGYLTVTEFKAKRGGVIAAASNAEKGSVGVKDANAPKPSPFGGPTTPTQEPV